MKYLFFILLLLCSLSVQANKLTSSSIHCLAKNIYFESRNQSYLGMFAVGYVTINRVHSKKYPNTICGVVKQTQQNHKCQFSWYCDGLSDRPKNIKIYIITMHIASMILFKNMYDFTEGSTHYHTTNVNPYWKNKLNFIIQIDDHLFYKKTNMSKKL